MSSETEGEGTDFTRASPDNAVEQDVPATPAVEQDSETEELVRLSPTIKSTPATDVIKHIIRFTHV